MAEPTIIRGGMTYAPQAYFSKFGSLPPGFRGQITASVSPPPKRSKPVANTSDEALEAERARVRGIFALPWAADNMAGAERLALLTDATPTEAAVALKRAADAKHANSAAAKQVGRDSMLALVGLAPEKPDALSAGAKSMLQVIVASVSASASERAAARKKLDADKGKR